MEKLPNLILKLYIVNNLLLSLYCLKREGSVCVDTHISRILHLKEKLKESIAKYNNPEAVSQMEVGLYRRFVRLTSANDRLEYLIDIQRDMVAVSVPADSSVEIQTLYSPNFGVVILNKDAQYVS